VASALQPPEVGLPARFSYERRRPEQMPLYQVVQEELETFLVQVETHTGSSVPAFVKDEREAFLECGILAHGFLRPRCSECAHERLVAFSCKGRVLPLVRGAAHGRDSRPPGRSGDLTRAGQAIGAVVSDSAANSVRGSP